MSLHVALHVALPWLPNGAPPPSVMGRRPLAPETWMLQLLRSFSDSDGIAEHPPDREEES